MKVTSIHLCLSKPSDSMTLNTVDPSGFTIRENTNKTYSSEITHQIDSAVTQFLHMQHANQSYAEVEANVEYYAYLKLQAIFEISSDLLTKSSTSVTLNEKSWDIIMKNTLKSPFHHTTLIQNQMRG